MGWLSDLFGGDDAPQTLQTSTKTSIPDYVDEYSKSQLALATAIGNRPFNPYTGERVAATTAPTQQGWDLAQSNVGSWQPAMNTAGTAFTNQAGADWRASDISGYMNPYMSTMKDAVNRAYDIGANQQAAGAVGAGAFGGARQGVQMAEHDRNRATALADIDRQGYQDAYDKWKGDIGMQAQGGQNLANMAGEQARLGAADVASLSAAGAQQQGQEQMVLDAQRQAFGEEEAYPIDMFNLRQSALANLPYAKQTTGYNQAPSGNTTAGNIGALGQMVGGVGSFFSGSGTSGTGPSAASNLWSGVKSIWPF